ncbi:MAG: glycosyltransferase family 39 protein [Phycisphaerae bacterium]|nr:glycosyltransferase family 39 protein [Phycisphaerae bacterium]
MLLLLPCLVAFSALAFLASESPLATLIIVSDGAAAVIIWVAAVGLGWWIVTALGLSDAPLRWQLVLAAGIGIGSLSLLVLLLGWLSLLNRAFWIALLGVLVLACAGRAGLYVLRSRRQDVEDSPAPWQPIHLLWLSAAAFLVIALLEATAPPGLNWGDEAGGYDVLEYHFGGPKEYWLSGRVRPLPHNIYTYFPFNAEMLYLLAFVVKGGPFDGMYLAQLLNASLAIAAVAAAWLAGREFGPAQGVLSGVLAGTCPWLTYLSGVAYVENGLVFMTMLALAIIVRIWRAPSSRRASWYATAGLVAGLACGLKYTAVPMVLAPVALGVLLVVRGPRRWMAPMLVVAGAVITFSPWLIKNAYAASNPLFPMGHQLLGYRAGLWDSDLAARWDRAHAPQGDERAWTVRMERLWRRVLADPKYGPGLFLVTMFALPAALRAGGRLTIALLLTLAIQIIVWLTSTHLLARFAVPLIAPLILLPAVGWAWPNGGRMQAISRAITLGLASCAIAVNLVCVGGLYYHHSRDSRGNPLGLFGLGLVLAEAEPINEHTPAEGTNVWMIGEARAFYVARPCQYHVVFSRNPLADYARAGPTPREMMAWFRQRGVTHVYIGWSEIQRFRRPGNYGWDEALSPDLLASMRSVARVVHAERHAGSGAMIYELLEVPRNEP